MSNSSDNRPTPTLFKSYGGISAVLSSLYFWTALSLALLSLSMADPPRWPDYALKILPSLLGFSIAAYAIMFAIMDQKTRDVLSLAASNEKPAPLLRIISSIAWAVLVQGISILLAVLIEAKPVASPCYFQPYVDDVNTVFSIIGLVLFYYSILLVISTVVYIYNVISAIVAGVQAAHDESSK
jgi:hypothetical protein